MRRDLLPALFLIGLLAAGCGGNDDEPAAPANPGNGGGGGGGSTTITAATVESVTFTLDGTPRTYTNGSNNTVLTYANGGESGVPTSTKTYGCGFYNENTEVTYIEFHLGKFLQQGIGIPDESVFFGWIGTGEWPYGDTDSEMEKAEIKMYDAPPLYTEWSSRCGAQSGASFDITQVVEIPSAFVHDRVKYRVTFNCKLYQCGGSGTRTITNGTAVVSVVANV